MAFEETAEYFNDTATALAAEGFHDEAVVCLKKGLLIDPYNGILWFNLGLSYRALHRSIDSVSALTEAAKLSPDDADIWDTLGIVLFEIGSYKEASIAYKQALKLDTFQGRIWNNYGTLLFSQKKYDDARQAFESAIALDPNMGDAVFNLRDTYLELGQSERAKICDKILDDLNYGPK
ncbi:MAG: hypothetical protein CR988_03290 [Treponema sp.]|nr:MAG: hypothetical protein CR988_03290 [Treponema sp.]